MRILGIDPGSRITGYGLIEGTPRGPRVLAYDVIKPPACDLPDRLVYLYRGLSELMTEHEPDVVAVETAFYHKSARSTLVLGQVRGVLVMGARERGVEVSEISPREVKLAVTGNGGASKEQVQFMVRSVLKLKELPPVDASDALALAICTWQRAKLTLSRPASRAGATGAP
jgi:crossover junction endodeoxyribonuclease RuvC